MGKWIFGEDIYWGSWASGEIGTGANRHHKANGHLGERGIPSFQRGTLSAISPNVYKWALGQMGSWEK